MKNFSLFLLSLLLVSSVFGQIDHWETAVHAGGIWKYRLGTSEPSANWNTVAFNDAAWLSGRGSIGYGDGDDNTTISRTPSLYMRQKFTVTNKTKIVGMVLHADFDDGFVAYLNGVEIARSNLAGSPPAYNANATTAREAVMYQGGDALSFVLNDKALQQLLVDGENVLAVQTHNFGGTSSSDMTTLYWLSFGISDASQDYSPTPLWFTSLNFETPLPIVKINTWGEYIPDEPAVVGEMGIIWNGDGNLNYRLGYPHEFLGNIDIERRGQTSLSIFPKNGFAIETKDANGQDLDVKFLNFPEEEDWVLHGPYSDKSLIRNVLAMELGKRMGQYSSRTRLVELFINEEYEGVYVLMEKIKRDKNRVDIANLKPEDIAGDELTGGYVFKIDKDAPDWYSRYNTANSGRKLEFQYVSPKRTAIQPAQELYIQAYVDSFERALRLSSGMFGGKRYDQYMDVASFADHFILTELTKNVDGYRLSTYLYKDKDSNGGLLKAGPIWDYNLAFGNADYCNAETDWGWIYDAHCGNGNPFWWQRLFREELFINTVRCRWEELRAGAFSRDSLHAFIDDKAALLATPATRNFQRWPILGTRIWPNPVVPTTYQGEINYLKSFITDRLDWMDRNMLGVCTTGLEEDMAQNIQFEVYPNPAEGQLFIEVNLPQSSKVRLAIYDMLGREIWTKTFHLPTGKQVMEVDLTSIRRDAIHHASTGIFYVKITQNGVLLGTKKVMRMLD